MKNSLQRLLLAIFTVLALAASAFGAPAITTQPASTNWTLGQTGTLTVAATGVGPLSYQWRKFGAPIAGATATTLKVNNVTLIDAGFYDVAVTDISGAITSAAALVDTIATSYPNTLRPRPGFNPRFESYGTATSVLPAADGGFYVFGSFVWIDGTTTPGVARFLASGALDPAFTSRLTSGIVYAAAIQADGKLVIGGIFTVPGSTTRRFVVRLNPDGAIDPSFSPFAGLNNAVNAVALLADGRIVASTSSKMVCMNADGSANATYGTGVTGVIRAMTLQSDGKLVLGGNLNLAGNSATYYLVRLNADGSPDSAFNSAAGGALNNTVRAIAIDRAGRLLIGGDFTATGSVVRSYLARLNADGTVDAAFLPANAGPDNLVASIVFDADGKLLVGGYFSSYGGASHPLIVRVNPADGSADPAFSALGIAGFVASVAVLTTGKVALGGGYWKVGGVTHIGLVRLNGDGTLDPAVASNLLSAGEVSSVLPLAGGQWLVGGTFISANGAPAINLARLNADGTTDLAYLANHGVLFNGPVGALLADPAGKVYVAAHFNGVSNVASHTTNLIRLNADGTYDATFATTFNADVGAVTLQADGRIIVAGSFTTYGSTTSGVSSLVRLNVDGSLDPSLTVSGSGFNSAPEILRVQPDGKILVGGRFSRYNDTVAGNFIRLKADGSVDSSFQVGTGFDYPIHAIALRTDGSICVGGEFGRYNGTGVHSFALLGPDGMLKSAFSQVDGVVRDLFCQGDNQVIVHGGLNASSGFSRSVGRIYLDGSVGAGFSTPTLQTDEFPTNTSQVHGLADGSLLVSGENLGFAEGMHFGLTLLEAPATPVILQAPETQTASAGAGVTLHVSAEGGGLSYQWYRNGVAVSGATGATLELPAARRIDAGSYTVVVSDLYGFSSTSAAATLSVNLPPATGHLVNLSTRAAVGTGDNALIVGFVISGTDPKPVLVRGVGGATLALQKVSGPLPDPVLDLYHGSVIGHNDNWATAANPADIAAVADRVGAFALPSGSVDSALSTTLQPGVYSAILYGTGAPNTGVGLVEIYDAQEALTATTPRLVNLSSRGFVGTGDEVMIAGFVVSGDQARQVLIRGIGPTLTTMNVSSSLVLADPAIDLHHGADLIASNDNWGSAGDGATLDAAATATGAFALPVSSKDAAMLVTLQPGVYSVIVSGTGGATGIALVELYELP